MSTSPSEALLAARLIYKGLTPNLVPQNDPDYVQLIAHWRADPSFQDLVENVALGLELRVLDVTERGIVVVPTSQDSRFAVRLGDLRDVMKEDERAAMLLAITAIAAVFYPTTDVLEDDHQSRPPATLAQFCDTLVALARKLEDDHDAEDDLYQTGWQHVLGLPRTLPGAERASLRSVEGLMKITIARLTEHSLLTRQSAQDDAQATYGARHRLRVQLRELGLRRMFELARQAAQDSGAAGV